MERRKKIEGIYNFVEQNRLLVTQELNFRIPTGTIINYNKNHTFGIQYDPMVLAKSNLRVYTKLPDDNSSQGHAYITEDDNIEYLNNSKIVMDIIIEIYKIEQREQKLKQIGL